jgi:hypothetical protein
MELQVTVKGPGGSQIISGQILLGLSRVDLLGPKKCIVSTQQGFSGFIGNYLLDNSQSLLHTGRPPSV